MSLLQGSIALLESLVGSLDLLLVFLHLIKGEQSLLVAFTNIVKILFKSTVVVQQFLLLVYTALIVSQQLLLFLSLTLAGLTLGIECKSQHDGNDECNDKQIKHRTNSLSGYAFFSTFMNLVKPVIASTL